MDVTVEYHTIACRDRQPYNFCNNSFSAYVWESNITIAIPHPITSYSSYRRFATINHPQNADHSLTIPVEVNSKFIVLGFRDQGGCRRLYSVKVSYDVCVGKTLKDSLVSLPQTLPPLRNFQSIPVKGNCTTDSVQTVEGSMTVLCESSGEWNTSLLEGRCVCKENRENTEGICNGMFLCLFCFFCVVSNESVFPPAFVLDFRILFREHADVPHDKRHGTSFIDKHTNQKHQNDVFNIFLVQTEESPPLDTHSRTLPIGLTATTLIWYGYYAYSDSLSFFFFLKC